MPTPVVERIEYESPKRDKFQYNHDNTFFLVGTGLDGAQLDDLRGCTPPESGKKDHVEWTGYGVLPTGSTATRLHVHGTPSRKATACKDKDGTWADQGTVTPTVSNGGATTSPTVPCNYTA